MSFDPAEHRQRSLEGWEEAASGWVRRRELVAELGAPVSRWLLRAVDPHPGQRLLELAAGLGETGLAAAELLAPTGGVIVSDQAETMLEGARTQAIALNLNNVEFQVLNAEWIDLPVASVDAIVCRWGFMLMADPAAALGEARRVLRPDGRLALAVWDALAANPWAALPARELRERGLAPAPDPDGSFVPGPFALSDPEVVRELLETAGFAEVELEAIDLERRHGTFEDLWETTLDLSRAFHDTVLERPEAEVEQIRSSLAERFAPYTLPDGTLAIPARTLVASASA